MDLLVPLIFELENQKRPKKKIKKEQVLENIKVTLILSRQAESKNNYPHINLSLDFM